MFGSTKHLIVLGVSVGVLDVILGTMFWLTLGHRTQSAIDREPREQLIQYGTVPDFSLTERSGENITLAHLRGKIWIADFIYTRCTDTCPLQSGMMARLQEAYSSNPDFQLV